ncbi:MAG: carbon starvation protein A [Clostridiales bacterium]|nr:carbon starvation protein A [Clostridiales bacterium]
MTALCIILAAIVLLVIGYIYYGSWLAKQWGIDPARKTPAYELEDGVDYVAAPPAVLMGHHFSSIAGAGPINGPIQASIFGWVPVFLWCVIGGIFFGGLQDFCSLFASIRHKGKTVGEIIHDSMGKRAQRLFTIFALLVLILVIASFVNVVAGTFYTLEGGFGLNGAPTGNQTTAMISVLFIVLAILYGMITNRFGVRTVPATIMGIAGIVVIVALGLNVGLVMSRMAWIVFIGIYLCVASLAPVWILLQPRDYLSSFLLYGMMFLAVLGIAVAAFTGSATFAMPAFTGWSPVAGSYLFPTLFITVACGACSGFHSLIATGTSSKQLENEKYAKPIGYGSMLIESALGIVALIAVGMVYQTYREGGFGSPAAAFAAGIGLMYGEEGSGVYNTIYALLTLAVSVFALTSLDTATRLSRFMFSELFLKEGEKSYQDATGFRRVLTHPLVGTAVMVVIGCVLGALSLSQIWGLFGAANQLLAGIALMAIAAWLGNVGKNNKMFFIPMIFMLAATICSLILTDINKIKMISAGTAAWGDWFQLIFATAMVVLALILVVEGVQTFSKQAAKKTA